MDQIEDRASKRVEKPRFQKGGDGQMLAPFSVAFGLISPTDAGLAPYLAQGSAVSDEARVLRKNAVSVVELIEQSQSLFAAKNAVITQIRSLATECSQQDWDGEGAEPVSQESVENAERFIRAIPTGFSLPEVSVEPDGAFSLDWMQSRYRLLSLSIGPGSRLPYAWLDGTDRGHGVVRFDGFTVPARLLIDIRRIVIDGHAPVRAA